MDNDLINIIYKGLPKYTTTTVKNAYNFIHKEDFRAFQYKHIKVPGKLGVITKTRMCALQKIGSSTVFEATQWQ